LLGVEIASGRVYRLDAKGDEPPRFANSGVGELVAFLAVLDRARRAIGIEADDDEWTRWGDALTSELQQIDPAAMVVSEPLPTWAGYVETLKFGF
jgi:hypothetical protein